VRLLLDTHVLLWWLANHPSLTERLRSEIVEAEAVFVSAASAWEIAIKQSAGRLDPTGELGDQLQRHHFEPLTITVAHALTAGGLPRLHNDPFDRMLVAQAMLEELTLVTTDARIARYEVARLDV
jgi:PIN domain nuclease of toxin-antitoxin system